MGYENRDSPAFLCWGRNAIVEDDLVMEFDDASAWLAAEEWRREFWRNRRTTAAIILVAALGVELFSLFLT